MKTYSTIRTIMLVIAVLLTGCGPAVTETPTATPVPPTDTLVPPTSTTSPTPDPTDTPIPPTETPVPTTTSPPTSTPVVIAEQYLPLLAEERYEVPGGGFTFQAPLEYDVTVGLYEATLMSADMMTTITLSGSPHLSQSTLADLQQEMGETTGTEDADMPIEVIATTIGGEAAIQVDMVMMEWITSTTVIAFPQGGEQEFYGAMVHVDMEALLGMPGGVESEEAVGYDLAFAAVLASLGLIPIPASALLPDFDQAACTVSTDETYGLSESNPIILYHYPRYDAERMDEYLALMFGPEEQPVQRSIGEDSSEDFSFEFTIGEEDIEGAWQVVTFYVTHEGLAEPVELYFVMLVPDVDVDATQPDIPAIFACK